MSYNYFMADNYQIDKNSKLFQKFLNLKNNKSNEPMQDRNTGADPPPSLKNQIKVPLPSSNISGTASDKINERSQLHVTIGDIQQAASMSFQEEDCTTIRTNHKKSMPDHLQQPFPAMEDSELPVRAQFQMTMKEDYGSNRPLQLPKHQKPRQRRNRDYDRNRGRQGKNDRSFRMNESIVEPTPLKQTPMQPITRNEEVKKQKQNLMSLNQQQETTVREENMFTLGSREGQYKKKYEKLHQKYEELKETIQKQRKQKQKELNDKQAEIELIRQKYFQLRSNEDTLTNDLKRLKDKLQSENMIRTKYEQEVKQLNFKIQEMEDMMDGKQGTLKKRSDEVAHWKAYGEQLRGEMKELNAEIERLEDRCQFLQSQNRMIKKDIQNKDHLIDQLRKNVNTLIEENNIAKDEIYKLTIKSYHYEQENQIIKGDLMRRDREQPPQMSAIQESFMRSIETLSPKRREARQERYERPADRQERPEREQAQGNNRRREFARERAVTSKPERQERPAQRQERRQQRKPNLDERKAEGHQERKTEPPITKHNREVHARIQQLQSQLQRRKDQKAMTGKLRREKIQMQRELQQLIAKLNQ